MLQARKKSKSNPDFQASEPHQEDLKVPQGTSKHSSETAERSASAPPSPVTKDPCEVSSLSEPGSDLPRKTAITKRVSSSHLVSTVQKKISFGYFSQAEDDSACTAGTAPVSPQPEAESINKHSALVSTENLSSLPSQELDANNMPTKTKPLHPDSPQQLWSSTSCPDITPTPSTVSMARAMSPVKLPSCITLNQISHKSESNFIKLIKRINSAEKRPTTTTNANFSFVQRSGKEPLLKALEQIKLICALCDEENKSEQEEVTSSPKKSEDLSSSDRNNNFPPQDDCIRRRADIVRQHCVGIYGYASDEYYRVILCGANAIQIMCDAMRVFLKYELVQASGNLVLGKLCATRQSGLKLVESGGLRQIIDSIKHFPESPSICSLAVNCLCRVTEVTDLALLFLENMHDAQEILLSVPESVLGFESLDNWKTLTGRFQR